MVLITSSKYAFTVAFFSVFLNAFKISYKEIMELFFRRYFYGLCFLDDPTSFFVLYCLLTRGLCKFGYKKEYRIGFEMRRSKRSRQGWARKIFKTKSVSYEHSFFGTVKSFRFVEIGLFKPNTLGKKTIDPHVFGARFFHTVYSRQIFFFYTSHWWYNFRFFLECRKYILYMATLRYNAYIMWMFQGNNPMARASLVVKYRYLFHRKTCLSFFFNFQFASNFFFGRFILYDNLYKAEGVYIKYKHSLLRYSLDSCAVVFDKIIKFFFSFNPGLVLSEWGLCMTVIEFAWFSFRLVQRSPKSKVFGLGRGYFRRWYEVFFSMTFFYYLEEYFHGKFVRSRYLFFFKMIFCSDFFFDFQIFDYFFGKMVEFRDRDALRYFWRGSLRRVILWDTIFDGSPKGIMPYLTQRSRMEIHFKLEGRWEGWFDTLIFIEFFSKCHYITESFPENFIPFSFSLSFFWKSRHIDLLDSFLYFYKSWGVFSFFKRIVFSRGFFKKIFSFLFFFNHGFSILRSHKNFGLQRRIFGFFLLRDFSYSYLKRSKLLPLYICIIFMQFFKRLFFLGFTKVSFTSVRRVFSRIFGIHYLYLLPLDFNFHGGDWHDFLRRRFRHRYESYALKATHFFARRGLYKHNKWYLVFLLRRAHVMSSFFFYNTICYESSYFFMVYGRLAVNRLKFEKFAYNKKFWRHFR